MAKAEESLAGAESEFANGRYNNCASRCYYACFQAAVHALAQAGVRPARFGGTRSHTLVQGGFVGQLINRRKAYSTSHRQTLMLNLELRLAADYRGEQVTEIQAARAPRRSREFLDAVRG